MKKEYVFLMFLLCFFVWAIVVDDAILPSVSHLKVDNGTYSRYRVKEWGNKGKLNLLQDEILIYARVKGHERLYYMDRKPYFEMRLKTLESGTPIQLRYSKRFPKIWKKSVYDLRVGASSALSYSPGQLKDKQRKNWKFTGIMAGAFCAPYAVGLAQ